MIVSELHQSCIIIILTASPFKTISKNFLIYVVIRHNRIKYCLLNYFNAFVHALYNVIPPKADDCPAFVQKPLVYFIVPFPVSG